jgi:hypothetical protein
VTYDTRGTLATVLRYATMMTTDPGGNLQTLGSISLRYRMLLGEYTRDRKEKIRKDRQLISNLRKARKGVSESITPRGQGYWAASLDLFGNDVVYSGGFAALESLFIVDAGTLAALIEWNRINVLRIERILFFRRLVAYLVTGVGIIASIVATLDKLKVFDSRIVDRVIIDLFKLWGDVLFHSSSNIILIILIIVLMFLEVFVWRPGKEIVEDVGQMLAVAFAYVSQKPGPETDGVKKASEGHHA